MEKMPIFDELHMNCQLYSMTREEVVSSRRVSCKTTQRRKLEMLKGKLLKLAAGAMLIVALVSGIALSSGAAAAHTLPAHLHTACVEPLPPCI
jgi:hypothetical protein